MSDILPYRPLCARPTDLQTGTSANSRTLAPPPAGAVAIAELWECAEIALLRKNAPAKRRGATRTAGASRGRTYPLCKLDTASLWDADRLCSKFTVQRNYPLSALFGRKRDEFAERAQFLLVPTVLPLVLHDFALNHFDSGTGWRGTARIGDPLP